MTGRVLVVSADDFGLTPGVSRGILRAAEDGVLTSTSVLVVAPAFASHASSLRDSPLGVGVHLALVGEDPPLLSAREVPTLVDRRGAFPASWRQLLARLATRRVDPADVRRELRAQVDLARSNGLFPTHLDSHQHVHVWPSLVPIVEELAREAGIPALRHPVRGDRSATGRALDLLSARATRRYRAAGLRLPDTAVGMDRSGRLDVATMAALIEGLGARADLGSAELATHPGLADDPDRDRYRWGYRWSDELEALCSPEVAQAVARGGWRLGTFADMAATAGPLP